MSAKVLDSGFVDVSADAVKAPKRSWAGVAVCGFTGSVVCFAIGLVLSALVETRMIAASMTTAYITVGILLTAFALAFLGAHAMDRNRSAAK